LGPKGSVPSSFRGLRHDQPDLGRLEDELPHARGHLRRLLERDAGREIGADPDDPLVELGQEFRAGPRTDDEAAAHHEGGDGDGGGGEADGDADRAFVAGGQPVVEAVAAHARAGGEQIARQRRDQGEGQDQ
jgi:hypothetical protein